MGRGPEPFAPNLWLVFPSGLLATLHHVTPSELREAADRLEQSPCEAARYYAILPPMATDKAASVTMDESAGINVGRALGLYEALGMLVTALVLAGQSPESIQESVRLLLTHLREHPPQGRP